MWPFKTQTPTQPKPVPKRRPMLPEGLLAALEAAQLAGGQFVIILAHYDPSLPEPNRYWRRSHNFPVGELDSLVGLVQQDVAEEKRRAGTKNGANGRLASLLERR